MGDQIGVRYILEDINKDLPRGVDWKAGARRCVDYYIKKNGRAAIEHYSLTKPFANVAGGIDVIEEMAQYFYNYINLVKLVQPPYGATILDVACGGGWLSHYFTKIGCKTFGIDISSDFVELAKKRIIEDRTLGISPQGADSMFAVWDIEERALPGEYTEFFDIAVLESCLHHFFDPISAMHHLTAAMKPSGIVVIIEGENRTGPIKNEYMQVMLETDTLERPYSRDQFLRILSSAGLDNVEFLGQINGWISPDSPYVDSLAQQVRETATAMNLAVCSKTPAPIAKLFPHRKLKTLAAPDERARCWFARMLHPCSARKPST